MKNERAPPKLSPVPQRTIEFTYTIDDACEMRGYTWITYRKEPSRAAKLSTETTEDKMLSVDERVWS